MTNTDWFTARKSNKEYLQSCNEPPDPLPEGTERYSGIMAVTEKVLLDWLDHGGGPVDTVIPQGIGSEFLILPDGRCYILWGGDWLKVPRSSFRTHPR